MKELIKRNEGITLIALIITIIILIILTAITLNNVIGTDLIGFATKAAENYIDAGKKEEDEIDKLIGITDNLGVSKDSIVKAGKIVTAETETKKDGEITYNYTDVTGRHAMIPTEFKVSTKSSEQYIKDGLVIQDEEGNEFVWVPCYYGETKPEGAAEDVQQYHIYEGTEDGWKKYWYPGFNRNWKDGASDTAESYGNKSVKKYGGFYIARYEAGWDETTTEKLKEGSDYITIDLEQEKEKKNISEGKKPISKPNVFAWNFISQENALDVSDNMYPESSSVDSKLVDGTAWDTITNWIAEEVNVTESTSYGNYNNANKSYTGWYAEHVWSSQVEDKSGGVLGWLYANKFKNGSIDLQSKRLTEEQWNSKKEDIANEDDQTNKTNVYLDTNIEIPTGSFDGFKLKNIYDLAGNMWEWTTEVGDPNPGDPGEEDGGLFAVMRGGSFHDDGTVHSLCYRHGYNRSSACLDLFLGFRVVLYIK